MLVRVLMWTSYSLEILEFESMNQALNKSKGIQVDGSRKFTNSYDAMEENCENKELQYRKLMNNFLQLERNSRLVDRSSDI